MAASISLSLSWLLPPPLPSVGSDHGIYVNSIHMHIYMCVCVCVCVCACVYKYKVYSE